MAIITLSRGGFSGARELAQRISAELGYGLVSREDIVEKTAEYGTSGDKRDRARRKRLGVLPRMDLEWIHYRVYARAALTKEIRQGNLVYLGDNGRALLHDFPNSLSVKVVAGTEYRIDNLVERAGYVISRKNARRLIQKIDEKDARWGRSVFDNGRDHPPKFDLVIDRALMSIADSCELIRATLGQPRYQATAKSLDTIDLLTVAAELRARIAMRADVKDDDIEVQGRAGVIVITPHFPYQPCRAGRNQQRNYPMEPNSRAQWLS